MLQHYLISLNDSTKCKLLELLLENNIKLFNYNQAVDIAHELTDTYASYLDSTKIYELKNESNIWNGLRNSPAQFVVKKDYTKIDLVDGYKIPVSFNHSNSNVNFLFDTGANISGMIESTAKSMGLQFLDGSCKVRSILGNEVSAKIALAKLMQFGNIELENVVFLVFPDSALYFPKAKFQIYGTIGFPVISALKEIQITKSGQIIIPSETTKSDYSNLALDFLSPIIEVVSNGDSLPFTFDSGAGKTWLYEKYYKKYKEKIDKKYHIAQITLGGVGRVNRYEGYYIDFQIEINNDTLALDSTILLPRNINSEHKYYYGNLGQDVIKSFDKMTINFDEMFVKFSNDQTNIRYESRKY